jgi:hypothetical protein
MTLKRHNGIDPDPEGAFVYYDDAMAEQKRIGEAHGWEMGKLDAELARLTRELAAVTDENALLKACDTTIRDLLKSENARLRALLDEAVGVLEQILTDELDAKTAAEFGGYTLDDDIRENAKAVLTKLEDEGGKG